MSVEPTKSTDELMQEAHELVAGGHLKEAEQVLLDVIKRGDKKSNLECFEALSVFAQSRGDIDESIRFELRKLATNKELYGEDSDQVVASMVRLAQIYEEIGKDEEANDLLYRAKVISDRLVFGEPEPEPEVGSAEQAEQFRSTLKYYAKQTIEDEESVTTSGKTGEDLEKDPDDLNFVFAEDEPRQEKSGSGWLIDSINKAKAKGETTGSHEISPSKVRPKGEITGSHRFRTEDSKDDHGGRSSHRGNDSDAHDQSESRTNASVVRKELLNTDSHLAALAHSKDEITRSLNISSIKWSFREFVKKRANIVAVGIGACVFFFLLLVAAYFQPRKVTPLDAYVSMPHAYKSMSGDARINLVREDSMQLQQGDTAMTLPTSYVVDWRSHLEVLVRSSFEKHYWLRKLNVMPDGSSVDTTHASSLISDDGIVFYTLNDPELLLGDQMRSITQDANAYYLDHSHYPPEGTISGYRNIYTRAASKPKLKRSEFLATDADDVLHQVDNWKAEVANPKEAGKAGTIDCFELLVSYPKGKVELFAVRSSKPNQKAQLVVSTNGELSANKTAPFVPEDGGIRPRRVWIEIQNINELDAFCLHHANLVFWIFISIVVSTSYAFLSLRGPARRIRYRILFVSLALVAIYAAGTVFSF